MKNYAITIENKGAIVVTAKTKKAAVTKLQEQGYQVASNDVYLY